MSIRRQPSPSPWNGEDSALVRAGVRKAAAALEGVSTLSMLAAGLAHEVNNPLAYVLTNLDFVREQLPEGVDPDVAAALDEARMGALRIGAMIRCLRLVATNEDDRVAETDLGEVAEAACALAQGELPSGSKLTAKRGPRVTTHRPNAAYVVLKCVTFAVRVNRNRQDAKIVVSSYVGANGDAVLQIEGLAPESAAEEVEREAYATGLVGAVGEIGSALELDASKPVLSLRLVVPAAMGIVKRLASG
ncbi:MAG TPA: hypothetical protein VF407_08890 [Polyangiaceae bacterium]